MLYFFTANGNLRSPKLSVEGLGRGENMRSKVTSRDGCEGQRLTLGGRWLSLGDKTGQAEWPGGW